jgi:hypothetical protein
MSGMGALGDDDVVELAELLEFLHDWIDSAPEALSPWLGHFSAGGYTLDELGADLGRFVFLLGGDGSRFVHGAGR